MKLLKIKLIFGLLIGITTTYAQEVISTQGIATAMENDTMTLVVL